MRPEMVEKELINIIEALLFASPEPLTQSKINLIFEDDPPNLSDIIEQLQQQYHENDHGIVISEVAGGYQLVTRSDYDIYVKRMLSKSGRLMLSPAALETIAIIAYKQPLNRYEIESIRGVDCTGVLKTLLSRNLIKVKGRDEGVGRPLLYATTDKFLEYFGLNRLADMPKLREISEITDADEAQPEQTDAFE